MPHLLGMWPATSAALLATHDAPSLVNPGEGRDSPVIQFPRGPLASYVFILGQNDIFVCQGTSGASRLLPNPSLPSTFKYTFGPVLSSPWASGPHLHRLPFPGTFCVPEPCTAPEVPAHEALQGQGSYSSTAEEGAEAQPGSINYPRTKSWNLGPEC